MAELPGSVIGCLEVLQPRPFWVTLTFFGTYQFKHPLQAMDREIVFDLDDFDFECLGGEVNLRVVDRGTGAPIAGARVTLEPELIAEQTASLASWESNAWGLVKFTHPFPGPHKLLITHKDHRAWRHLVLGSSVAELGDIRIGGGADVLVRVVDADGKPVPSVIEIAPCVPGGLVEDLYSLDVPRATAADGSYMLPLPEGPSAVRARPTQLRGPMPDYRMFETLSFYLDPDDPPHEIVLVAQLPLPVKIDVTQARVTWEDGQHLDFVYPRRSRRTPFVLYRVVDPSLPVHVVPGGYHIRRWDGGQEILSQGAGVGVGTRPATYTLR